MATMICDKNDIKYKGELQFFDACSQHLNNSIVVYHNRDVQGLEFDFLLLIPGVGLCVAEIKGWKESSVSRVLPTGKIELNISDDGPILEDPRNQARSYQFALGNTISHYIGKRPFVFYIVCYPYLSESFVKSQRFDANCDMHLTFCKEDLLSSESVNTKLRDAIEFANHRLAVDLFDENLFDQVRNIFEPGYLDKKAYPSIPSVKEECKKKQENKTREVQNLYSVLCVLKEDDYEWRTKLDKLLTLYSNGTKIFAVFSIFEMQEYARTHLEIILKNKLIKANGNHLVLGEKSSIKSTNPIMIFNWTSYVNQKEKVTPISSGLWIENGDLSNDHLRVLQELDNLGLINEGQYRIEHAPSMKNILVKAGAGTGKTAVMIDRISFLIYRHHWSPAEIVDRIVMITFTNEAADNMKSRLKQRLEDYYLLTGDGYYLEITSHVDHMQISTIHSYAKKLIGKYGSVAGYGSHLSIESGRYNRQKKIEESLEQYVKEQISKDSTYLKRLGLPVYELRKKLLDFISSLENKSIDLTSMNIEQFGNCAGNTVLHNLIFNVVHDAEKKYAAELKENNRIYLGRLMPILSQLIDKAADQLTLGLLPVSRYMFIDEFQDTDDVQIHLLQQIASKMGYYQFVVGDVKQCIYRFRGAEEMAFDRLPTPRQDASWLSPFFLKHNYRTDNELLKLFERKFICWGNEGTHNLPFIQDEDALDNPSKSNHSLDSNDCFRCISITDESERLDRLLSEINHATSRIRHDEDMGKILSKSEKTVAILVRENWQIQEIIDYAEEHAPNLHIATQAGGNLFKSIPALEMLTLLYVLEHHSPEYLSKFVSSNFISSKLDKATVYSLGHPTLNKYNPDTQISYLENVINQTLLETKENCQIGYDSLENIRNALRVKPILQVLHNLYRQLTPWTTYGAESKQKAEYYRLNTDKLFELFIESGSTDSMTLNTLTRYLENCIFSGREEKERFPDSFEEGNDISVVCMTVHKSKGLEFGHVILPYTSFNIRMLKRTGMEIVALTDGRIGYNFEYGEGLNIHNDLYDRTQEEDEHQNEETRILYVAMTRAQHAFSWIKISQDKLNSWQHLLDMEGTL